MLAHGGEVSRFASEFGRVPAVIADRIKGLEPQLRETAVRHEQGLHQLKHLLSGGIAGCVAKSAVAPLSRVTVLMQVQSMQQCLDGKPRGHLHLSASLKTIFRQEGMSGFWRGNIATILHRFPYTSVTFYGNGALRRWLSRGRPAALVPERTRGLVAGGCSAGIGVLLCYPLDVIKTRLMTQTHHRYYMGTADALRKIGRDEGFRGYYRGLSVSLMSVVPTLALNFALYEELIRIYRGIEFNGVGIPGPLLALLAGGSSGAISSTMLFPVDLLRRQMQMVGAGGRSQVYTSVLQAAGHVFSTGCQRHAGHSVVLGPLLGLREFFRGLVPELLKVTPNNAIMFCVYSQLVECRGGSR